MDGPKPNDITRLNALALMNIQDIASAHINELVNDYFITRPVGNDESNSDLSELSTDECEPELDLVMVEEVNGSVNGECW